MDRLNGAQIQSAQATLEGVSAGTITSIAAVELLMQLGISNEKAQRMVTAQASAIKLDSDKVLS